MPAYFGMFRSEKKHVTVTCSDGTTKVLAIRNNPIDSGSPGVCFNGKKLTHKVANKLYDRDKDHPFGTNAIG